MQCKYCRIRMKASDFDLVRDLKFDLERGITTYGSDRMVILHADALGLLRYQIIEEIGFERAREIFLRFGFRAGFSDALEMRVAYDWDTDRDLLEMAPRLHTYQGICRAETTHVEIDIDDGVLHVKGHWYNSYEGSQHRMFYEESVEPVCWSQIGYAAGYGTGMMNTPVISVEKQCIGAGHEYCTMESRIADEWGAEADMYREAYGDLLDV